MEADYLVEDSLNITGPERSCLQRAFGPMGEGSLRAQILLLIMTTLGSTFFFLPYCAKRTGLLPTFSMLLISACASYASSSILYIGYENTKAKTYNECMELVLGKKVGYFSNLIVFFHTFAAVLSTWIFSFKYLTNGAEEIFEFTNESEFYWLYKVLFFACSFLLVYLITLSNKLEKLKMIALVAIAFIIYLVGCFGFLTPKYYSHYKSEGKMNIFLFKEDLFAFKAFGICMYVFLNQFTIIPICNSVQNVTSERAKKIFGRTIFTLVTIYISVIFVGYFTEPDDTKTEVFLLRIPLDSDRLILFGKMGFGLTLLVAVMVKGHYLLLYLHELIATFPRVFLNSNTKTQENKLEEKLNDDENQTVEVKSQKVNVSFRFKAIINFFFLALKAFLAVLLLEKLSLILSITGSLLGFFEIAVLPVWMLMTLNKSNSILSTCSRVMIIIAVLLLGAGCLGSLLYNLLL